ncbi:uncharacterized protein B0T15DRAFT_493116 [Chaetomium strumarium]|uniref:Uncharacterized protein n=1 Tax=Chaetomium strumarium TaxID=1170767 RepID=A0AAJ0GXF7_9PEZI|nr:hypothetical protein B0T15DRAFT_493116 [Chaetomium strumarium]
MEHSNTTLCVVQKTEARLREAEAMCARLAAEKENLQASLRAMSVELDVTRRQCERVKAERKNLRSHVKAIKSLRVDLATAKRECEILKKERDELRGQVQALGKTPIQLAAAREECEYTKVERNRLQHRLDVVEADLANLEKKHIFACNELAAMQGGRLNFQVQLHMPREPLPNVQSTASDFEKPPLFARSLGEDTQSTSDHATPSREWQATPGRTAETKTPNNILVPIKEEPGQERRGVKEGMQLYRPPRAGRKDALEDMEPGEIWED